MVYTCAIAECQNGKKAKKSEKPNLIFHAFPADKNIRKIWVSKCKRDIVNPVTAAICSEHFKDSDYMRDLQSELLGEPSRKKRRLMMGSIPSIFPGRAPEPTLSSNRDLRSQEKERKLLVSKLILNDEQAREIEPEQNNEDQIQVSELRSDQCCQATLCKCEKIPELEKIITSQAKLISKLTHQKEYWRKRAGVNTPKMKQNSSKALDIFSSSQKKLINGQNLVHWSTSDIVKALSIRAVSLKSYETMRSVWKMPLPSTRTLRNWVSRFKCQPGILHDVLDIMREESKNMDEFSRLCVLAFDEMHINSQVTLDPTFDKITSGRKAQVVMLRGLTLGYKQPIFYDFDTDMTKELMFKLIKEIEKAGFLVVAIVSDLGVENRSFWKELDISPQNVSFPNPVDPERKIFVFSDVPHDLKNISNHLVDDGVILIDGEEISLKDLEYLVEKNGEELAFCPKLTMNLLQRSGPERMRVAPAAQLLSHRVACLAKMHLANRPSVSEFFEIINNGFDALNGRVPQHSSNKMKSGYGRYFDLQNKALEDLKDLMITARFKTKKGNEKKGLLPCQTGFIVSINALQQLYKYLQEIYPGKIRYILASRLNQDALESFFSLIRSFGGSNVNPNASEFRYRFRLILLGSKLRPPKGTNVEFEDDYSYMSSELLAKNKLKKVLDDSHPTPAIYLPSTIKPNDESDSNRECLSYIAGYIAWKLKRKNKGHFGTPTGKSNDSETSKVPHSWIRGLSKGGLLIPNDLIFNTIETCETQFNMYYATLKCDEGISAKLFKIIIDQFPDFDKNIVTEYLRLRLKIKVKSMNNQLVSGRNARKKKQFVKSGRKKV